MVFRHSFGPDRWIENAGLGRLNAIEALAIILFSVRNTFNLDNERRIVEQWANELRAAAEARDITPRDPVTVSYTHLDVYKRQVRAAAAPGPACWG